MADLQNVRMIIVRKHKISEADLIIHGLLADGSRLHAIARGALKSRKRFGGGILEPTHYIEGLIKPSRTPDGLAVLEDAKLLEGFTGLRSDYERLDLALRLVNSIDRSSPGGELAGVFNLLGHALKALAAGEPVARIEIQFTLKFLKLHGVLESEPWMSSYLMQPLTPIAAQTGISPASFSEIPEFRRKDILERLKQFVATASL